MTRKGGLMEPVRYYGASNRSLGRSWEVLDLTGTAVLTVAAAIAVVMGHGSPEAAATLTAAYLGLRGACRRFGR
jgi:hypothetical protein